MYVKIRIHIKINLLKITKKKQSDDYFLDFKKFFV